MSKKELFFSTKLINNLKIVILSDIHFSKSFKLKVFTKLLLSISKISPDYIFIIGDLIDYEEVDYPTLKSFLHNLEQYSEVIIVIGNHEFYKKDPNSSHWQKSSCSQLLKTIHSLDNTILLTNDIYHDYANNLTITGLVLDFDYYKKKEPLAIFKKSLTKLPKPPQNTYNILLVHTPYNILKSQSELKNYQLILSGHMHAGLVPAYLSFIFPKNRGLISPWKKPFPNMVRGRYKTNYSEGYIYEGVTKLAHSSKIFHKFDSLYPKKVLEIELQKGQK